MLFRSVVDEQDGLPVYGRVLTVADRLNDDRVLIAKWVRRLTQWKGRHAPYPVWKEHIVPRVERGLIAQNTPAVRFVESARRIVVEVSLAQLTLRVPVDAHGVPLWKPAEREVLAPDCARCDLVKICRELTAATGTALLWRRLGLVDAAGIPTRRGEIVSCFSQDRKSVV